MERKQFTFYASFFSAISRIKKAADRAAAYDAVCDFALYGTEPDLAKLPDAVAIVFDLIKPNLISSRRKSEGGSHKDNDKIPARCEQDMPNKKKKEGEKEKEKEVEVENECYTPTPFDEFWKAYPKKIGKGDARKEFDKIPKSVYPLLIPAIEKQKLSAQWNRDDGQYIPNPSTWLHQERWEDEPAQHKESQGFVYDYGNSKDSL